MKERNCFISWGVLYVVCVVLGFCAGVESEPLAVFSVLMSLAFFVPPLVLVFTAARRGLRLLRNLSLASLGLTLALLVASILSIGTSTEVGDFLYGVLIVVSAPMIAARAWVLSLFAWAVLLMLSLDRLYKLRKRP
ncbi:MAG: hypothetical protein LUH51_01330 [Firmicutes bacterium]|nr:hypothetical protein [Bacillota bacterium]